MRAGYREGDFGQAPIGFPVPGKAVGELHDPLQVTIALGRQQGPGPQLGFGSVEVGDRPTSPGSPWQNGHAERLIGTVRRECLDRMLIFGEQHLRRVLALYAAYYNQARTHLALGKDAPLGRATQRSGVIVAIPILSGLHHQYVRI